MGESGQFPQRRPAATVSRYPTLINYKVHAGSFHVPIIHRTMTWTTGSLACVPDHSCACVYTLGLGTLAMTQHNIFWLGKTHNNFLVVLMGFESRVFRSRVWLCTNWATLWRIWDHPDAQTQGNHNQWLGWNKMFYQLVEMLETQQTTAGRAVSKSAVSLHTVLETASVFVCFVFWWVFYHFVVPMGISPMGNVGRFFLCSWRRRGSNLQSLDLESNWAIPRLPFIMTPPSLIKSLILKRTWCEREIYCNRWMHVFWFKLPTMMCLAYWENKQGGRSSPTFTLCLWLSVSYIGWVVRQLPIGNTEREREM